MADNHSFNATEKDFEQSVVARSKTTPVVVDFWAPWCGPCRALTPILERQVEQRGGDVLLAKVNIDEEPGLATRYGVSSIPTVIAFRDGKPVLDFVGLLSEHQLGEFLNRIIPSQADRQAQEAAALAASDPQQAETLYRQVLQANSNHDAATVGLARLLVDQGKDGEATELLDRVGIAGELGNEIERLNAVLWLRQNAAVLGDEPALRERSAADPTNAGLLYELGAVLAGQGKWPEALEMLYQAAARDRKLAAAKVRETMVKVFHAIGVRSPLADEYRDKLASVLY